MAIIKEYMSGNCKITVHDDYITNDPEEIKRIIDRVSKIVIDAEIKRARENKKSAIPAAEDKSEKGEKQK